MCSQQHYYFNHNNISKGCNMDSQAYEFQSDTYEQPKHVTAASSKGPAMFDCSQAALPNFPKSMNEIQWDIQGSFSSPDATPSDFGWISVPVSTHWPIELASSRSEVFQPAVVSSGEDYGCFTQIGALDNNYGSAPTTETNTSSSVASTVGPWQSPSSSPTCYHELPLSGGLETHPPADDMARLQSAVKGPSDADMNPTDIRLLPQRQKIKDPQNMYLPCWIRGHGKQREAWCGLCSRWLSLKRSTYWYHQNFIHGITAAGRRFPAPAQLRPSSLNSKATEGLCATCNKWIPLGSNSKIKTSWYRHAYRVLFPSLPFLLLPLNCFLSMFRYTADKSSLGSVAQWALRLRGRARRSISAPPPPPPAVPRAPTSAERPSSHRLSARCHFNSP